MPSSEVFHKWKTGKLHSGSKSGPPVKSHAQAIAIYLSEKRAEAAHGGKYPEKALGGPMMGLPETPMMGGPNGIAPGVGTPMMGANTGMGTPVAGMNKMIQGPMGIQPQQLAVGGIAMPGVGNFNMAKQANLSPSPMMRTEQRSMMHGPVLSSVAGRTDAHKTAVLSGSYVIPADVVSGRGQGNTMAGMNVWQKFFKMGPYGSPAGQIRPGRSMPPAMKPPKPIMTGASGGGKEGGHMGKPVPVNVAGGELIVPPEKLLEKWPGLPLDKTHAIMDKLVVHERKKHIKTLNKLPGPVKD